MYLFHELPPNIRRQAAAEMARVLKPGGCLVITDSIQLGDRERLDANLSRFGDFNEPFYRTYISEDFGARPLPVCHDHNEVQVILWWSLRLSRVLRMPLC